MPRSQAETVELKSIFAAVEELYIGGGGGAGRSLPAALEEAVRHGLDFNKVHAVCGASVGSILALALVMEIPIERMFSILENMPTDTFQDWSFPGSLFNYFHSWGWCKGEAMPAYFRTFIKEHTGLEDPTFEELYEAGYKKELRIVATNAHKRSITLFSHKRSPHHKVADIITLSCSVSFFYPPRYIVSPDGELELHTDGGVIKNYPFGVGSEDSLSSEQKLGFTFVNGAHSEFLDDEHRGSIKSFIQYVKAVLTMLCFNNPFTLDDAVKRRTVAIRTHHNPLVFTASAEEQEILNQAGREGVQNLVAQIIKNRNKRHLNSRLREREEEPEPLASHFHRAYRPSGPTRPKLDAVSPPLPEMSERLKSKLRYKFKLGGLF